MVEVWGLGVFLVMRPSWTLILCVCVNSFHYRWTGITTSRLVERMLDGGNERQTDADSSGHR